jgi:XRE family transcriptional regulator, aerobic/anaerobic benzoate catabolism transcriptional regulator
MAQSASTQVKRTSQKVIDDHEGYLMILGERVRTLRARRGISRKILSSTSDISERYLAQLESGRGNISISLLRQVAFAMDVSLEELVRDGAERSVEHSFLLQHLNELPSDAISKIYALVMGQSDEPSERVNRIALIGLRGAGKSTLGRALARKLDFPFVELVREIEREAGMSINEVFSLSGQASYRRLERQCLENTVNRFEKVVISVGGSLVSEPGTYERLLKQCYTVWLKADPEEHMKRVIGQGDYRPMAGNVQAMDDLRRILADREALYGKADTIIDTSADSVEDSLQKLLDDSQIRSKLDKPGV